MAWGSREAINSKQFEAFSVSFFDFENAVKQKVALFIP
jgi:hypothetical protein